MIDKDKNNKFTKGEVLDTYMGIKDIKGYLGVKFNMALACNYLELEKVAKELLLESERIQELIKPLESERIEFAKNNATKDKDGSPVIVNNVYQFTPEVKIKVDQFYESLKNVKYKTEWAKFEKESKDYNEELKAPVTTKFNLRMIEEDWIPEDLKTEHFLVIANLIKFNTIAGTEKR